MIAAKIEGEDTVEAPAPKAKPAADILSALERSLAVIKKPVAAETGSKGEEDEGILAEIQARTNNPEVRVIEAT